MRTYTACCYYLDRNNIWQTEGLVVSISIIFNTIDYVLIKVGPKTNHNQTQCLSTHLTIFTGGFLVLPSPINWNYVFSHADFIQNKTIYSSVICISILYLLLIIYARYKDKKVRKKICRFLIIVSIFSWV